MKRILVIGTYPIVNPQHGGQKRLDAICKEYANGGLDVRYVAVFYKPFYKEYGKYDIALPAHNSEKINSSPFTGDIVCGNAIYEDAKVKKRMSRTLLDFRPDVIHVEQVFPYLGLKRLLKELKITPKIVFGSQNIEYSMKEEMLTSLGYGEDFITDKTKIIYDVEKELSEHADLVAAVSANDLKTHIKLGAKKTVLAANGIYKTAAKPEDVAYWRQLFKEQGTKKIILFVGSAHPPNWIGFQDTVGKGLGFLGRDTRIVFAGSISEYVENELSKVKYDIGAATLSKRAYFAGRLSEDRLVGLLKVADVILLPITEGGGSNLKTAEAIVSDKKVVATKYAFRGFENLKHLPNIYTASNSKDFRDAIVNALASETVQRTPSDQELEKQVLWQNCLKDLVNGVKSL